MDLRRLDAVRSQLLRLGQIAEQQSQRLPFRIAGPKLREASLRLEAVAERYAACVASPPPTSGPIYERSAASRRLVAWLAKWRPIVLLAIPSAHERLRVDPPPQNGKELCTLATELFNLLGVHRDTAGFRADARAELGQALEAARREHERSDVAFSREALARQALTEALADAARVLALGAELLRNVLGPDAPELDEISL